MKLALGSLASIAALVLFALPIGCGSSVSDETDGSDSSSDEIQAGDDCSDAGSGSSEACTTADGSDGTMSCGEDETGDMVWGECAIDSSSASTPLVVSFDGQHVAYSASSAMFDLNGQTSVSTDWPTASTPWLAMDVDGNGRIDDGSELFGSGVVLSSGAHATNGFAALAELDANHDGRIDANDPAFSKLVLWADANADRQSDDAELTSVASRGIVSIELSYKQLASCDARNNCEIERATMRFVDANGVTRMGNVVDVHLAHR